MISEQPPRWNQSKPLLTILGIFTICAGVSALIFSGYWLNWTWTGFLHKTLWEWMQLLSVPAALAASALSNRRVKPLASATGIEAAFLFRGLGTGAISLTCSQVTVKIAT
jgi:hypothetical protein